MDPHPLANLFKRSNYDESIVSELNSLDYLYEVLLEIYESENCDGVLNEEIYEVIHDISLNEKHDCNYVIISSINVNCANDMQNPKLGDANFAMPTTYCNDHDWGDIDSWVFYICAPGSLALLIHPHALNFCSFFPTPLPETLRRGRNGRRRRVSALTVNSYEWGRVWGVAIRLLGHGFIGSFLALNACARRHDRCLQSMHPTSLPACVDVPTEPACADQACMR